MDLVHALYRVSWVDNAAIVYPLYIQCIPIVYPLYTRENWGGDTGRPANFHEVCEQSAVIMDKSQIESASV